MTKQTADLLHQPAAGTNGSPIASPHLVGVALVLASVAAFSTHGLFTKGVAAGPWEIIFWRGVFAAAFTILWSWRRRQVDSDFPKMGASGLAVGIVGATATAAFIPAFKLTTIANVTLIYATAPILAAAIAWLWIGERITLRMALSCVLALIGVVVIVSGSLGQIHLGGDLLALWMTLGMAVMFVIYRRYPQTPAAGPQALSSLLLLPVALALGKPFEVSPMELAILAVFGLSMAVASVTLAEGARRIPAGETALLSSAEVAIAPVLAWLVLAELPAEATWIGGALVVAAVLASQLRK